MNRQWSYILCKPAYIVSLNPVSADNVPNSTGYQHKLIPVNRNQSL